MDTKSKVNKKKIGRGICDFCGNSAPLCYFCTKCGFTLCQSCLIGNQKKFLCASALAWICPNCSHWETL